MSKRRLILAALTVIMAITLFFTVDIATVIGLLQEVQQHSPFVTGLIFVAIFVVSTVLGLPTAALLTIASGMLFGFVKGVLLTSLGAGISMISSFLFARYLFHSFIQHRFASSIVMINEGIEKEGILYLFFLRMVPGVPFSIMNMGFGLTHMPLLPYWIVSQIAMIPITLLLVNAGIGVADITSIQGVLTLRTIVSLAGIALIPVVLKVAHSRWVRG